jgi:pimeloyl-ACP methyl ester carboxylesterase
MTREIIHFAPANSFPARSYNKLFSFLSDEFEVGYLELHAHNEKFPVTNGWKFLADELKNAIENRYSQPVIGVGHSLGGILHFFVAVEKPELYKAIVLLDSPIISRLSGAFLKGFKRLKLMDKFSPSSVAIKRRNEWESKPAAIEHFERKFRTFDREMIRDYVEHGTIPRENGHFELLFKPETEAEIYRTIPDDFTRFRGKLRVPAVYIGGTDSREARLARLGYMRHNFPFKFHFINGSHHFPFENPRLTAEVIKNSLRSFIK